MNVTGPYRIRLGSYPYPYVFKQMNLGVPVWQCNRPADYYDAEGMVLYLYKMGGRWEVAHGPDHLWHYNEFLVAQYLGQVATIWGSWDEDIMEPGTHYWDSYDGDTQQWVGENAAYETAVRSEDVFASIWQLLSIIHLGSTLAATRPQN